jgi:hypothetical protein
MLPRLALTFALAAFVCPAALYAQPPTLPQPSQPESPEGDGAAPAHVAHVDGAVTLEREGRAETSPLNMPLLSGDRLRTVDGRVEVLFADGSTLHLDMRSTIDVQSDDLVRLTEGRLRLNIVGPLDADRGGPAGAVSYRIDSPAGSARITQPGEYRIAVLKGTDETQLEVAVIRGAAEIFTDQGMTPVRAGERAYASAGLAPSYAYAYNSANQDAFDRWSEERRDVRLGASSQYLPSDMQEYAPLLDESGDWRYTESSGYAWYPRVDSEWRPYYNGRWASYPRYGWTWIGADRFAWPTHHYGRWGFSAGVWFWTPSSRWAPAYVSWGSAPGYVSWCPLGFDNRPIFGINSYRSGPGSYSSWRGWTAVSSSHFGSRDHWVNQRAVNWDRAGGQRPRFEPRASAPGSSRDVAVPRNSAPIRWAGSRNLPPAFDGAQARQGGSQEVGREGIRRSGSPGRDTASPSRDSSPAGRDSASPRRDPASSPRDSRLPPSGGREVTAPPAPSRVDGRTTAATPRYVNRGDEIIRSQTERPTPRPESARAVPRSETRTIPDGPARPSDGAQGRPARPESGRDTPSFERPAGQDRSRTYGSGGSGGAQVPSYQPSYRTPSREAAPSAATEGRPNDASRASRSPRPESNGEGSQDRPHAYERSRPSNDAPSRPSAPSRVEAPAPERAAPSERAPAPSRVERAPDRGEGRQPPPERSAPSNGTGGERAAPRATSGSGASASTPRRGRGGV